MERASRLACPETWRRWLQGEASIECAKILCREDASEALAQDVGRLSVVPIFLNLHQKSAEDRPTPHQRSCWAYGSSLSPTDPHTTSCRALMGSPGSRTRSFHACRGLRHRRVQRLLAFPHSPVLPSAHWNSVGTLISDPFHGSLPSCMFPCQRFTCSLSNLF